MKNRIKKAFLLVVCALMLITSIPFTASAEEPYKTYTYSIDGYPLYSPAAYSPVMTVDSKYIGLLEGSGVAIDNPTDIFADKNGNVYITDTANSRVVVTDKFYKLKFTIGEFSNQYGAVDSLNGPQGVYVNDEYIYVCDTANYRIVVFDLDGNFVKIIPKPESELFGKSNTYKPVAMAVDKYGRIFVISSSTYQGVIVMTEDGTFTGFVGAQKVTYSVIDMVWRRFMNDEQRKASLSYVSTELNNITVDEEGFIYVTVVQKDEAKQIAALTSKTADYSPVKKLNSKGAEIMKRNGFFDPGGEVAITIVSNDKNAITGASQIKDVAVGPENTWTIIDAKRSKSFTYDQNGNLLFAFGDIGEMLGQIKTLAGITYQGDYMLLLDNATDSFTVYRRTNYGDYLINAIKCENDRNYSEAIHAWEIVLQYNNNFDTAYIGVGKAYYRDGEFAEAMEYFKAAYETENYSRSYQEVRKGWISDSFIGIPNLFWILIIAVAFCFGLVKFLVWAGKVNKEVSIKPGKRTYGEELIYCFHLAFHPFDGYWDLKHEKRGSVRGAITIMALTVIMFFYQSVGTGYIMNPEGTYSTIWIQIISVMVPVLLWIVANWCLTTLFDGEGSFKDIFIAVGYALTPMPIMLFFSTLISNIVTEQEAALATMLVVIGYVWAGMLIFFGMMVTHDYTIPKNILTTIGTIVGMVIIIFVTVLFSGLIGKIISFISSIIVEISYRL